MRPLTYILALVAFASVLIAAIPKFRQATRDFLRPDHREIIAKIDGSVSAKGPHIFVFKIKTRDQFFLEIYRKSEDLQLMQRIALEEPLDGRFQFQGHYTNLALADMEMDGSYEIVAPMYDRNSTPRLLVYKYNEALETFEKIAAE